MFGAYFERPVDVMGKKYENLSEWIDSYSCGKTTGLRSMRSHQATVEDNR